MCWMAAIDHRTFPNTVVQCKGFAIATASDNESVIRKSDLELAIRLDAGLTNADSLLELLRENTSSAFAYETLSKPMKRPP